MSEKELARKVTLWFIYSFIVLGMMFFLSAGTLLYWQAWVYMAVLFIPMALTTKSWLRHEPGLLKRRMRFKEKTKAQNIIMIFGYVYFALTFIIPGLDKRWGWSTVPVTIVIAADVFVLVSYLATLSVFKVNKYASRIIEVEKGQRVVTTGPYAVVRHPMYLAAIIMFILSPLALGSYWGLIPAVFIIPVFVARLLAEEKLLLRKLEGYREYTRKTKYRLIPGVW